MRTINWTNTEGKKECSFIPTSTRELRRAFLCAGVDAWISKRGGIIDIYFEGGQLLQSDCRTVQDMTVKAWVDFAKKNAPARNICTPMVVYPEMMKYITNETL